MGSVAAEPGARLTHMIHSTGITELYVPPSPIADICFVHGFTGHPERTWKSKQPRKRQAPNNSYESPTKRRLGASVLRKLRIGGDRSNKDIITGPKESEFIFWPRDLVPDIIPEARVLTFGYDTHIRHTVLGSPSKNRLIDHARDFLAALEDCRLSEPTRPLIFIAHSLGGLLVKDTLRISKEFGVHQPERALVYSSTTKLVFFGTPHAGADPLGTVHQVLANLVKALGWKVNEAIVQLLMPDAERLEMLRDSFQAMVHERNWCVYTFQEELPLKSLSSKVVEDASSCINELSHERVVHIHADHVGMCRFGSTDDPGFRKVAPSLERIRQDLLSTTRAGSEASRCDETQTVPTKPKELPVTTIDRQKFLEKLSFENIDVRYLTLKTAQRKTCEWLPKCHLYEEWKDLAQREKHHGFFWIKGKPGTGKSVMMKYLFNHTKRSKQSDVLISFFFNARGSILERSTEGLYRSLLFQLINGIYDLNVDLNPLVPLQNLSDDKPWPLEALKGAFGSIVEQLSTKRLVCFIDALDECPEDQIRDMIDFFEDIGEKAVDSDSNVRICFSSRHYPSISIQRGLQITLENESDHSHDIQVYIQSKLRMWTFGKREEIAEEIFQRSSNIFLWAVLVVEILNKEYDKGGGINARKRLRQIPMGLHELFQDILTRDTNALKELVVCLQWILFANRPLRPEELYFAIRLELDKSEVSSCWNQEDIPMDQIDRFNLNVSKGLTEITKKQRTIQFIHESVRDYLLKDGGLQSIMQHQARTGVISLIGSSHELLKQTCLLQIQESLHDHIQIPDPLPAAFSKDAARLREQVGTYFPFLEYAVHNVLSHANSAQGTGSDQEAFMRDFPRELWIKLDNILQKHEVRRHTDRTQLLYLLAEHNLGKLIERHPNRQEGCFLRSTGARYPFPLAAAMALGHYEAIESLVLETAGAREHKGRIIEEISGWSKEKPNRDGSVFRIDSISSCLCRLGSDTLFDLYQHRITNEDARMVSVAVLTTASLPMLRNLIQHGAEVDGVDQNGHTAIRYVIEDNDLERASYLLEVGADPNRQSFREGPLKTSRTVEATRLLLRYGAGKYEWPDNCLKEAPNGAAYDPISVLLDLPSDTYESLFNATNSAAGYWLLQAARAVDHPRSITLIRRMIKSNPTLAAFTNKNGETALHSAACEGNIKAIAFFCSTEQFDVNATNKQLQTPLHHAAKKDHADNSLVKILLDNGALPNATDKYGMTPFGIAIQLGQQAQIDACLEDPRIDVMAPCGREEMLAVHVAARSKPSSTLEMFLKRGDVDPDRRDKIGMTALMHACQTSLSENVNLLLQLGQSNINSHDNKGHTPLSHAIILNSPNNRCQRDSWLSTIRTLLESNQVDPLQKVNGLDAVALINGITVSNRSGHRATTTKAISLLSAYTKDWISTRPWINTQTD